MKTRNVLLGLMFVSASIVFFTQSCSKEDIGSISGTDLSLAQDETYADALFEEVDNFVSSEITTLDGNNYSTTTLKSGTESVCYSVTVDHPDSTSFPKIVTIDFGSGCSVVFNGDTITREGQINITVTNRWFIPGAQHIVTFNNYFMNGVKIEGTRTITNHGLNERNHPELSVELQNGKVIFNDTTIMTREASHIRELIRHKSPQNDTILVTGSANGINVMGDSYTREITEPLILVHCAEYQWRWVISGGKVEITNSARGNTTIDYTGSGCDGKVIVNKNGYKHNYEFKYKNHNHRGGH
jgi:hypothetical protein